MTNLKTGSLQISLVEMRSSWSQVDLNPVGLVSYEACHLKTGTHGENASDVSGKDWNPTSTAKECRRLLANHGQVREKQGRVLTRGPAKTLILHF